MSTLRFLAKRTVEIALCRSGVAAAARRRLRGTAIVLAYHNVVPDGELVRGDASLHLPQRSFARQIDLLLRTHDVVPLSALLESPPRNSRPRAVITIDDATAGALTAGLEELAARRLTATYFVAPAFVPFRTFWWDDLDGLSDQQREHALQGLCGADQAIREWARELGIATTDTPPHQRCGSEEQLAAAVGEGMTLGAHGWSHRNLAVLSREELQLELVRPLAWLRERFSNVLPWLAYPYGRVSSEAAAVTRALGYEGALRIAGGWIGRRLPNAVGRYSLPRVNIPAGTTIDGFALRTAGL